MKKRVGRCQLCERDEVEITVHHLTPKEEGGTHLPTVDLCIPCHKQIHAIYTNKEIAFRLMTLERLQGDEQLKKFIKWIQKQPPKALVKIRKSKSRR
nr:HNH endonuclease [Halalkalibacter alkaliphilus]